MLDDPARATIHRTSGPTPYPTADDAQIPAAISPRQVTLRDRLTTATLLPFSSFTQLPASLLAYLCEQLNREIELGDTYPMTSPMTPAEFGAYWFSNFGAVMLLGHLLRVEDVDEGADWSRNCLGSFYVKPNYPGRSSHVCNGGFLVCDAARNRGVGRLMGEGYLEWAPMLGYSYSVFNLVYETNVASCRIWDGLGFKRIGRVKGCGNLRSYPDHLIDAIIYGRDLGPEGEDFVSEQRFDKIKFYLKHNKYPVGADRAEKSRLRSAATHYKLTEDDRLMLKDKEVVADPQRQYEIAKAFHKQQHGGINKTTAAIAEKHHWIRIKETVSLVIRNCDQCKEMGKAPVVRADGPSLKRPREPSDGQIGASAAGRVLSLASPSSRDLSSAQPGQTMAAGHAEQSQASAEATSLGGMSQLNDYGDIPLDPQIMEDVQNHLSQYGDDGGVGVGLGNEIAFGAGSSHFDEGGSHVRGLHAQTHHTDYQALLEANVDAADELGHEHQAGMREVEGDAGEAARRGRGLGRAQAGQSEQGAGAGGRMAPAALAARVGQSQEAERAARAAEAAMGEINLDGGGVGGGVGVGGAQRGGDGVSHGDEVDLDVDVDINVTQDIGDDEEEEEEEEEGDEWSISR